MGKGGELAGDTQKPINQFLNKSVLNDNLVIFKVTLEGYIEVLFLSWSRHQWITSGSPNFSKTGHRWWSRRLPFCSPHPPRAETPTRTPVCPSVQGAVAFQSTAHHTAVGRRYYGFYRQGSEAELERRARALLWGRSTVPAGVDTRRLLVGGPLLQSISVLGETVHET